VDSAICFEDETTHACALSRLKANPAHGEFDRDQEVASVRVVVDKSSA
jgi:hypothetical protein